MKVPSTIEGAAKRVGILVDLAVASDWEMAAIIATFTRPSEGQGRRQPRQDSAEVESFSTFAQRGIRGFSRETISRYYDAWRLIARLGNPDPGAEVKLPTRDFPTTADVSVAREKVKAAQAKARLKKLPKKELSRVEKLMVQRQAKGDPMTSREVEAVATMVEEGEDSPIPPDVQAKVLKGEAPVIEVGADGEPRVLNAQKHANDKAKESPFVRLTEAVEVISSMIATEDLAKEVQEYEDPDEIHVAAKALRQLADWLEEQLEGGE